MFDIKQWRYSKGFTQKRAAEGIGKTQGYWSQLEAGKIPDSYRSLERLSQYMSTHIDDLRLVQPEESPWPFCPVIAEMLRGFFVDGDITFELFMDGMGI